MKLLPWCWLYQGGRIQIMYFIELQKARKIIKLLVAYLESLVWQRVDDIVRNFGVLGH